MIYTQVVWEVRAGNDVEYILIASRKTEEFGICFCVNYDSMISNTPFSVGSNKKGMCQQVDIFIALM